MEQQSSGVVNSSFLSLVPASILTDILCNWLELEEICKFDSASCESALRRSYLQCVKSDHTVLECFYEYERPNVQGCMEWLIMRSIKMSKFAVPAEFVYNHSLCQRFLAQAGSAITYIDTTLIPSSNFEVGYIPLLRKPVMEAVAKYCPNITHINQSTDSADETLCLLLAQCTKVQDIYLQDCGVSGNDVLSTICSSGQQLVHLWFNSCTINMGNKPVSGACLSLRNLEITHSNLNRGKLVKIAELFPNVTSINIDNLRSADLPRIAQACPHVLSFEARVIDELHEDDVIALTAAWKNIEHLCLTHEGESEVSVLASESSLLHILHHCPRLLFLELRCYPRGRGYSDLCHSNRNAVVQAGVPSQLRALSLDRLSAKAFAFVVRHCPLLESLSIDLSETGDALPADLVAHSHIRAFKLGDSSMLSAEGTLELFAHIQEISIKYCRFAKNDTLAALFARCPNLRRLQLMECTQLTPEELVDAATLCPELRHVAYRSQEIICTSNHVSRHVINKSMERMIRALAPLLESCSVEALVMR